MPAIPAWPPASTPRLYVDQHLDPASEPLIDGSAAHYLINVMRLKIGDPILLFDNVSGEWLATAKHIGKKSLSFEIVQKMREKEAVADLWLCFAPVKKARLDFIIEKATELGISRLQPVITERTIVERVKQERLEAQIIEACEQCGRTALPDLAEPIKLPQLLKNWESGRALIFADEAGGTPFPQIAAPAPAAILVGPEGGFTEKERLMLVEHEAVHRMALGPRILRAETAALSAIALWMGQHGDWR
jgi:16S rRNA (uracil1498-N3)-methyltransferase